MRRSLVAVLALTLVLVVAAPARAQELTDTRRAALADTIRQQAEGFISALSSLRIERFMSLFTTDPDLTYVDGGRIYPSREALAKAAGGFFKGLRKAGGRWDPAHVVVLGANAAAFTGVFHADVVDTTGTAHWTDGKIWTLVYERRRGQWTIVQAHEANVPPARR